MVSIALISNLLYTAMFMGFIRWFGMNWSKAKAIRLVKEDRKPILLSLKDFTSFKYELFIDEYDYKQLPNDTQDAILETELRLHNLCELALTYGNSKELLYTVLDRSGEIVFHTLDEVINEEEEILEFLNIYLSEELRIEETLNLFEEKNNV